MVAQVSGLGLAVVLLAVGAAGVAIGLVAVAMCYLNSERCVARRPGWVEGEYRVVEAGRELVRPDARGRW